MYVASMILAIAGMVVYHLVQKTIHSGAHPVASLGVTYLSALAVTALLIPFYPARDGWLVALRSLNWASYALGLTIVAIELGFLLVYRSGWTVNVAASYANVVTILFLFPVGILAFGEPVSSRKLLGVALAAIAVFLLAE